MDSYWTQLGIFQIFMRAANNNWNQVSEDSYKVFPEFTLGCLILLIFPDEWVLSVEWDDTLFLQALSHTELFDR